LIQEKKNNNNNNKRFKMYLEIFLAAVGLGKYKTSYALFETI
jgi:hypothetical protein